MRYLLIPRLIPPSRLVSLASLLTMVITGTRAGAQATSQATQQTSPKAATTTPPSVGVIIPGVPNSPDLVTVVPFYTKPDETEREKTKAVIPAEINGHRGIFIFDLGDEPMMLNRTFLQPNAAGGIDSVTDANRAEDHTPQSNYMSSENFDRFDKARITVRIGTLVSDFDDPQLTQALGDSNPHRYNAMLGHLWGNFGWVFAPRLGNIGPAAIEPFESIVDYTHKRVVLIKLDSVGHRMADVPAYTPRWTGPLLSSPMGMRGLHDLGIKVNVNNVLDTLTAANNTETRVIDTGAPQNNGAVLGFPFLSQFGAFGINQRTHQFILYRTIP